MPAAENRRTVRSSRRGAAAVEFAMTAPILFALFMSAIEFSRANMLTHTAAIAATEAARKAIIPGAVAADASSAAMRELGIAGISEATVQLDPPVINDAVDQVTVSLTVPLGGRNGYTMAKIFLGKELTKSVTLQREGKTVHVSSETVKKDGVRNRTNNGNNGNRGNGSGASFNSGSSSSGSSSGSGSSRGSGSASGVGK